MLEKWRERASRIDLEGATLEDRELLGSFSTCIVGEAMAQNPWLAEDPLGAGPKDEILHNIGLHAVFRALQTRRLSDLCDQVEARVMELKREMLEDTTQEQTSPSGRSFEVDPR